MEILNLIANEQQHPGNLCIKNQMLSIFDQKESDTF